MKITSPEQITGPLAKGLREKAGMTQRDFWGQFGASKCRASYYENEKWEINPQVKQLVYLKYICGIPVFGPHADLLKLGKAARDIMKQRKEAKQNGKP